MKAYEVRLNYSAEKAIREVEIDRITEKSVFLNGRRQGRETHCERWFEDFPDALKYLIKDREQKISALTERLKELQADMEYLSKLK